MSQPRGVSGKSSLRNGTNKQSGLEPAVGVISVKSNEVSADILELEELEPVGVPVGDVPWDELLDFVNDMVLPMALRNRLGFATQLCGDTVLSTCLLHSASLDLPAPSFRPKACLKPGVYFHLLGCPPATSAPPMRSLSSFNGLCSGSQEDLEDEEPELEVAGLLSAAVPATSLRSQRGRIVPRARTAGLWDFQDASAL